MRVTRTFLAVPANHRRMVESAARSTADAVFLDLEDAVPQGQKEAALLGAIEAINELDWGQKSVSVRINEPGSGSIETEVARLLKSAPRLDTLLIPKVEQTGHVDSLVSMIDRHGQHRTTPIRLEIMIETALGLANCEQIAGHSELIESLHFGVGDFSASIGAKGVDIGLSHPAYQLTSRSPQGDCSSTALDMWAYPMMRILVAARAHRLRAIDGPCGAFRDADLTRALAIKAASMGFDGKQVIHPCQIDATRSAFVPGDDEIRDARRVIAALVEAEKEGRGAVQVDGKLVDYANIRMAQRVIAMSGR
ncbi:HpcH/HpaI aldolase/citrate lyase family protein [Paraburkholderia sp. BCC1884]|uniref:HpcH/HpaI aldolase/citrate lyase family protein n=1 Tax=Paraburkholderia sp. BCC1884 TaxID=2562668 RepID=UPI00118390F2|nr:CoA ester lyase [Paraburkholderia sp. BCC1884]